jgi:hypothetical protein
MSRERRQTSSGRPAADLARDDVSHGCIAIDRDGCVQAFHESIRDALIARGDLRCVDGVWRLATSGVLDMVAFAPWLACCDFCSGRPVTWTLACRPFQLGQGRSQDDWAACEACGSLVVAGDRAGLLRRAQATDPMVPIPSAIRSPALAELHRQFWRHYEGRASRLPAHPFDH